MVSLRSRRDPGRRACFDAAPVSRSARVGRPPAIALLVPAVVAPQPRRVELRHRHRVFPQLEQRLQRAAGGDLAVVIERQADDLEHGTTLDSDRTWLRYTHSFA